MKIGILTFHRACNFGAILQCYALQEVLRRMGHDAYVIDHVQRDIEWFYIYELCRPYVLKGKLKRNVRDAFGYVKSIPERRRAQNRCFRESARKYYRCTPPCNARHIPKDFDAYVVGSDQVWNCECMHHHFDKIYLGDFPRPEGSHLYGYAISSTETAMERMDPQILREAVARFDALSLREENIANMVKGIIGKDLPICCDPTLLTDASFWTPVINDKYAGRNYVLTYHVRRDSDFLQGKAEQLASKLGVEVVTFTHNETVEDFVSLIYHARYVVTTSFHGTAFSLIFGKPLYAVKLHDGWDGRYENLLHTLGADHLCVDEDFDPTPMEVDYAPIRAALKNYAARSLRFLKQIG